MFIKRGDGQILSVVEPEDLTEEQKKQLKKAKKSTEQVDKTKKEDSSGR